MIHGTNYSIFFILEGNYTFNRKRTRLSRDKESYRVMFWRKWGGLSVSRGQPWVSCHHCLKDDPVPAALSRSPRWCADQGPLGLLQVQTPGYKDNVLITCLRLIESSALCSPCDSANAAQIFTADQTEEPLGSVLEVLTDTFSSPPVHDGSSDHRFKLLCSWGNHKNKAEECGEMGYLFKQETQQRSRLQQLLTHSCGE